MRDYVHVLSAMLYCCCCSVDTCILCCRATNLVPDSECCSGSLATNYQCRALLCRRVSISPSCNWSCGSLVPHDLHFADAASHQPGIKSVVVWQPESLLSVSQVWQRTNLLSVLWNYCYDHLLVDTLAPGESFIDFIAVSEHARGKGLGSLLMRWAEQTSVAIMLQRLPDLAGQDLCRILLRVSHFTSATSADLGGHHATAPP